MINCRLIPHLSPAFRSSHNLISLLKNPRSAVKKSRAAKITPKVDDNDAGCFSQIPKIFNRKTKVNSEASHQLYLVNAKTATKIAQRLAESIDLSKTFVETNPGLGLLTDLLVQRGITDLRLFEGHQIFHDNLQQTYMQAHPNRVKLKHFDLITLNIRLEQLSSGKKTKQILSELPSTEWQDDTNFTMFGATGSTTFFKHLICSIVFQNSILAQGRCEFYMVMPSMTYLTLTSSSSSALEHYRAFSVLFQIFFEFRLLDKFPRADFLPHVRNSTLVGKLSDREYRNIKGIQFTTVDPDLMYFVKIVPRRDLYEWCSQRQIQELWHFIELNCFARQNRIIPQLDKVIPGCGIRLLHNFHTKESIRPQRIHTVDLIETPPTTNPSMTLSDHDYYDNLGIFTQFGDLQPSQLLTLFREFRMLPEYSTCTFLPSLENVLLKKAIIRSDNSGMSDAKTRKGPSVRL